MTSFAFKSEDKQIAYSEVYAPGRPDADKEFMTAEQIEKTAHNFVRSGRMGQIDVMHDNKIIKASVVESFIARKGNPEGYIPDSWVVGVHVADPGVWADIKSGKINGFSMEAMVTKHPREVLLSIPPVITGMTTKSEDHDHKFYVHYDEDGNFKGGVTDTVQDHMHEILHGTHTTVVKGHSHRFSSVDGIEIMAEDYDG